MRGKNAYGFVDGAYLRELALDAGVPLLDPKRVLHIALSGAMPKIYDPGHPASLNLGRVVYYDAQSEDETEVLQSLRDYWDALELLPDTHLGFGWVRSKKRKRPRRQKAVDTLIAVEMLVGAFNELFPVAVLVAGDADYVPVINEVKRLGVLTVVAASPKSIADELKRAADRFFEIAPDLRSPYLPLTVDGRTWPTPLE